MSSPFEEWFKRRRANSWFPDLDGAMREIERMLQEALRDTEERVPKNVIRERKLEDGSTVREIGPIVYGYSVKIGQDGKPIVRKFGNVDSSPGFLGGGLTVKEQREPLLDIITGSEDITIVAELPGVNKEDLQLKADNKSLTLESVAGERQYQKKIDLPDEIEPNTSKSTYKNRILEVSFKRKSKNEDNGVTISID
ncbi:MAG TPA: archaeal heat shock protein Hsp20 [Nitrososphaeraceae archaeon]|jgi:HSP20 family protein|nr:archaeal heat shock protein Hsp20 [Nitrososphaeraceae archaeon]